MYRKLVSVDKSILFRAIKHKQRTVFLISCLFAVFLSSEAMGWGAKCLGPDHGSTSATCKNSIDDHFDKGCDVWIDSLNDHYSNATYDDYVQGVELCDDSFGYGCHDHDDNNLDSEDAGAFLTHGHWDGNVFRAKMSTVIANGGSDSCRAQSSTWKIGNDDAEFVSAFACYSATSGKEYRVKDFACGLHQWHGIHGKGCNLYGQWYMDDFADDGYDGSLSYAWIENMTNMSSNCLGSGYDMCGLTLIFGSSSSDCNTRRANENYSNPGLYSDPSCTSESLIRHYFCGCDPNGADPLPSC